MTVRTGSIVVDVPARHAWQVAARAEDFPKFLPGLTSCQRQPDGSYVWEGRAFGLRRTWTSRWTARHSPELLAWTTDDPMAPSGRVVIEAIGPAQSRLSIEVRYRPQTVLDRLLVNGPATAVRLQVDLHAFKRWVERRPQRATYSRPALATALGPSSAPSSALSARSSDGRAVGSS